MTEAEIKAGLTYSGKRWKGDRTVQRLERVKDLVAQQNQKGKLYWPRASLLKTVSNDLSFRILRPHGREVPELADAIAITLTTRCPGKWAMVDRETGEVWGHDGNDFRPIAGKDAAEIGAVVAKTAKQQ